MEQICAWARVKGSWHVLAGHKEGRSGGSMLKCSTRASRKSFFWSSKWCLHVTGTQFSQAFDPGVFN